MNKRILMLTNYFYPDMASLGQIMTELCEGLQDYFDITVIAAFPNYSGDLSEDYAGKYIIKEKYKQISILRVKVPAVDKNSKVSRIIYLISYFINSIIAIIISGRQDLIFTTSQPPIIGGMLGVLAKRFKGAKLVYNVQDFNPEQTEAVGFVKNRHITYIAKKIDNISCKISDAVVIVGRDMQDTLKQRFYGRRVPFNRIINNWVDETKIYPLSSDDEKVLGFKKEHGLLNKFVFMYSGNIGLFYDLDNLIKVIGKFKDREDLEFVFIGEGAVKSKLIEYCADNRINNIKFLPYQDKENLIYSLNAADVHLVMNSKGIKGVSVPSKIYGVMAVDKPILGILEEGSEARRLIVDSGCGICCDPGDYDTIYGMIKNIKDMVQKLYFTNKGRFFLESNLKKEFSIAKYRDLFNLLLNKNDANL